MATFSEVKQLLCRLFGLRDIKDDDDMIFEIRSLREEQDHKKVRISNSELLELYNKVSVMRGTGLELCSNDSYELAIDVDYFFMRRQEFPIISDDSTNEVNYEVGYPTAEYSLFILMLIKDAMDQKRGHNNRVLPMRLRRPFERCFYEDAEHTLETILPKIIGEFSLKIRSTSESHKSLNKFREMKTSFIFEYMYKTGNYILEFLDITDMFRMNNVMRTKVGKAQIDTPPLRKYTEDVVDYYKQALASNDPYIKYISFYHVMEYFFDEVFKRKMVTDLKNKITHPDFSYKDEDKIYDIATFVKNRWRMNDETGQGNELESLKYVLNEYISVEELKTRINIINSDALDYYQKHKVSFCNAPVIVWSDSQEVFVLQLAKRIYYTRNSLVHSKSGKNRNRYRPYQDEKHLQLEIPLVKAVAEAIIINSSEIM